MLVTAFAFAGHYMGQNAVAHNALPGDRLEPLVAPTSNIVAKGSLLPEGETFDIVNLTAAAQKVEAAGKGDIPSMPAKNTIVAKQAEPPAAEPEVVKIVPASVNLNAVDGAGEAKVALSPPKAKIEQAFRLKRAEAPGNAEAKQKRSEKQKVIAQRRVKQAEENCLARAIYFEARSESELGQLAVAKVILNRVKDPEYPNTICGVVYQGSGRRNSCQFSFACDGLPDDVRSASSWAQSKRVAQKALTGDAKVAAIGSATNYHADYVRPKWAKSMKRLIKIGRHIFYTDS